MKDGKLKEYLKLTRIEYAGFSCVIVIGALSVAGEGLSLSHALMLFFLNVLTLIWGFAHNDYCDYEIDRIPDVLSERPLVKGTVSRRAAVVIVAVCIAVNLFIPLIFIRSLTLTGILVLSMVLAALYNMYSKKFVGADVLYAGSAALLVLFGAVSATGDQTMAHLGGLAWVMIIFQFIDHFFFNAVEGGLKDVVNDQRAGVKTIATALVIQNGGSMTLAGSFKAVFMTVKIVTVLLIFIPHVFMGFPLSGWQVAALLLLGLCAILYTIKILAITSFNREQIGGYALKQELACKLLVPVMLCNFIGLPWTLFLLFVPLLWFHFFNYLLHGKLFALPKSF